MTSTPSDKKNPFRWTLIALSIALVILLWDYARQGT
ncbi:MAG: hypothetical protein ACI87O_001016 [Planctomycetota bacterium]|jgi:hypothetical protein